jgi:hypothetical protein
VRLITRGGYDWMKHFPWIAEAALKNRQKHFVINGEAVVLGANGISDFNALHSGKHNEVQLCAFDVLAMDGDELRNLPSSMRKTNLARLLRGRADRIFASDFEQGEIGPDLFRKACEFGLECLASAASGNSPVSCQLSPQMKWFDRGGSPFPSKCREDIRYEYFCAIRRRRRGRMLRWVSTVVERKPR